MDNRSSGVENPQEAKREMGKGVKSKRPPYRNLAASLLESKRAIAPVTVSTRKVHFRDVGDLPAAMGLRVSLVGDLAGDLPAAVALRVSLVGDLAGDLPAAVALRVSLVGDLAGDLPACDGAAASLAGERGFAPTTLPVLFEGDSGAGGFLGVLQAEIDMHVYKMCKNEEVAWDLTAGPGWLGSELCERPCGQ